MVLFREPQLFLFRLLVHPWAQRLPWTTAIFLALMICQLRSLLKVLDSHHYQHNLKDKPYFCLTTDTYYQVVDFSFETEK